MMRKFAAATLLSAFASSHAWAGVPMDFKGKMKEGLYEMTMNMEMSAMEGMPQGMKMPSSKTQHCITKKDIEEGSQKMLGQNGKRGEASSECEIKNFTMSGDTASYKMVCAGEMKIDGTMTFTATGYKGASKITIDKEESMKMASESRYLGACKS